MKKRIPAAYQQYLDQSSKTSSIPGPGLTLRSLAAGLLLSLAVGAAGPYCILYLQGSNAGDVFYINPVAHLFLFVLVGVINVAVGAVHRSWAFHQSELVAIFVMMTLANGTQALVGYWVAMVSGPFYYANPENNWAGLLYPHIPEWIAPRQLPGIAAFFEGSPGETIGSIWKVWFLPLVAWLPLIAAFHLATLCLMVLVRRQWAEQERIDYPLIQVPLAMVQDDEQEALIKPFFRSRVMWVGFVMPVVVSGLQGLNHYFPSVPAIQLSTSFAILRNTAVLPLTLSFVTLGLFFLIRQEVAFGLWAFSLFNILQKGLYNLLGLGQGQEPALSVWSYNVPSLVHQGMGAMIVLVLGGLWVGRGHLRNVVRKALLGAVEVDDSDEILSYRGVVFGLLGSLGVMVVWLRLSGIPLIGVFVFLFFAFVVFLAITRVVAEGGVAVLHPPLVAPDAAVSAMGTSFFGAPGLVGLMFTRVWANDILNFVMPHCANGLKLSEEIGGKRPWLFWGMLLAILAGLVGGIWMLLHLAYTNGAVNLRPAHFIWLPDYICTYAAARISTPSGPDGWGWFHTGVGALVMGLLMVARWRLVWWPLHPLGFPISSVFSAMMFNAFLAWLIKGIVLKYGGSRLYNSVRPFFLGLILGQFAMYGVFWIIDSFTGTVGNVLPW